VIGVVPKIAGRGYGTVKKSLRIDDDPPVKKPWRGVMNLPILEITLNAVDTHVPVTACALCRAGER
jgi:hypothetical protein